MSEIKPGPLEDNVPIPTKGNTRSEDKYGLRKMQPGQSREFSSEDLPLTKVQAHLSAACIYLNRIKGWTFTTRVQPEKNTVRVWRIK